MKISNKIKKLANKIKSLVPDKTTYHSYKYATSVHIHQDVDSVLKNVNKQNKVSQNVIQNVH